MDVGWRRLQVPDEAEVDIRLGVQLEPEAGPASLLSPRSVPAPTGPRLPAPGLPVLPRVRGDERCVLHHALLDLQTLPVELALQLLPDQLVLTRLGEALPEQPDSGGIRYHIGESEEPVEAYAVVGLALQLGVAEAVPGLEDQHLDHGDGVGVGSSSLGSVVQVEAIQDGSELLPVYVGFGFSWAVA